MDTLDPENPSAEKALYANVGDLSDPATDPPPSDVQYQNVDETNREAIPDDDISNPEEPSPVDDITYPEETGPDQASVQNDYNSNQETDEPAHVYGNQYQSDEAPGVGLHALPVVAPVCPSSSGSLNSTSKKKIDPFISEYSSALVMEKGEGDIAEDLTCPTYLVCILCFIFPTACWAICYAWNLREARKHGDLKAARHHSMMAKTMMGLTIFLGAAAVLVIVILLEDVWDVI